MMILKGECGTLETDDNSITTHLELFFVSNLDCNVFFTTGRSIVPIREFIELVRLRRFHAKSNNGHAVIKFVRGNTLFIVLGNEIGELAQLLFL